MCFDGMMVLGSANGICEVSWTVGFSIDVACGVILDCLVVSEGL